ncbi:MAG: Heimdall-CTERM domain-containing surface protein [Promethearchaeota archaeon]
MSTGYGVPGFKIIPLLLGLFITVVLTSRKRK